MAADYSTHAFKTDDGLNAELISAAGAKLAVLKLPEGANAFIQFDSNTGKTVPLVAPIVCDACDFERVYLTCDPVAGGEIILVISRSSSIVGASYAQDISDRAERELGRVLVGGSGALYAGSNTPADAVAVALGDQVCSEVVVQADPDNTADGFVGNASAQPIQLKPGASITVPVGNISALYVQGAGVRFNWLARS